MASSPSTLGASLSGLDQLERLASKGASRPSWCADEFNITDITHDPVKWNKDWERALRRMYSGDPVDVYDKAVEHWSSALSASLEREVRDRVLKIQRSLRTSVFKNPSFVIMWLLLSGTERERHALDGFRFSLSSTVWGQDARADATTSAFLKNSGQMFIRILGLLQCFAGHEVEDVLFVRTPSWDGIAAHLRSLGVCETMYDRLSLVRSEFILIVAHRIVTSVFLAFNSSHASESVAAAQRLMTENRALAVFVSFSGASFRTRPVVRCQRCEMCVVELRISPKEFKQCSKCRERLGCNVVYCSQKCQSADWPRHKLKCGRQLVAPPPGSAVDVLRSCLNAPEIVRMLTQGNPEKLTLNSIGLDIRHTPRSSALRRQIQVLEQNPEIDYALFNPNDPKESRISGFMLSGHEERLAFRLLRREVTSSEDARGAEALADVLIRCAEGPLSFTREDILNQFCAEYGEDLRVRLHKFQQTWGADHEYGFAGRMVRWAWYGPEDNQRASVWQVQAHHWGGI